MKILIVFSLEILKKNFIYIYKIYNKKNQIFKIEIFKL